MSKRISTADAVLIGVRVAGAPMYTPAYMPVGGTKPIRQMATVSVIQNVGDQKNTYKLTAWGGMADTIAKSCAPGKELTFKCTINTFKGRIPLTTVPGQPVSYQLDANGQFLTTTKVGFTIDNIHFGFDSRDQLIKEIQEGIRPQFWNVPGHADEGRWKQMIEARNNLKFVPGSQRFGYATVRQPNGQLVDPATAFNQYNVGTAVVNQYAGNPNAVSSGFAGVVAPPVMPAVNPVQPVVINGQNMGYPVQGQTVTQGGGTSFQM